MIHLIWGAPSQGKSYYATLLIIEFLKAGKRVFSNYPVFYTVPLALWQKVINFVYRLFKKPARYIPKVLSPLRWEEDYIYASLTNCIIVLDESYRYFNSHKRSVEDDVHTFFATTGHNDVDVYLIAQHYNRINLVIREVANYYIYVIKTSNPFSIRGKRKGELSPLFFTAEYYISEDDFRLRRIQDTLADKRRVWFSKKVAQAYNTQYYRTKEKSIDPKPITWLEDMQRPKDIIDMVIDKEVQKGIEILS